MSLTIFNTKTKSSHVNNPCTKQKTKHCSQLSFKSDCSTLWKGKVPLWKEDFLVVPFLAKIINALASELVWARLSLHSWCIHLQYLSCAWASKMHYKQKSTGCFWKVHFRFALLDQKRSSFAPASSDQILSDLLSNC